MEWNPVFSHRVTMENRLCAAASALCSHSAPKPGLRHWGVCWCARSGLHAVCVTQRLCIDVAASSISLLNPEVPPEKCSLGQMYRSNSPLCPKILQLVEITFLKYVWKNIIGYLVIFNVVSCLDSDNMLTHAGVCFWCLSELPELKLYIGLCLPVFTRAQHSIKPQNRMLIKAIGLCFKWGCGFHTACFRCSQASLWDAFSGYVEYVSEVEPFLHSVFFF